MKILTPSLLLITLFVFGGMVFKITAPRGCTNIRHDDTIFVLTGDIRRIPFAMRQMRNHSDADLYIIGAGCENNYEMAHRVRIESDSKSTYQNALAIRDIVTQSGLDRIVIVTTEDHMNRAQYLISHELPDTEIITCTAPLTGMTPAKRLERWAIEYIKYVVTLLGIKED